MQYLGPSKYSPVERLQITPATIEAVGVVIPVRNRADTLARCILSIFAANSFAGWKKAIWIVVVADACTDDSVKVARRVLGAFGEVLEIAAKSYRAARRVGASAVFDHFHRKPQNAILLANASANTCVHKDWITTQLQCRTVELTDGAAESPVGTIAAGTRSSVPAMSPRHTAPYSKIAAASDTGAGTDRPPILRSMRYINAREIRVVQTRT
jgi:hypothetical protein